jgi:hypothetical protein
MRITSIQTKCTLVKHPNDDMETGREWRMRIECTVNANCMRLHTNVTKLQLYYVLDLLAQEITKYMINSFRLIINCNVKLRK